MRINSLQNQDLTQYLLSQVSQPNHIFNFCTQGAPVEGTLQVRVIPDEANSTDSGEKVVRNLQLDREDLMKVSISNLGSFTKNL